MVKRSSNRGDNENIANFQGVPYTFDQDCCYSSSVCCVIALCFGYSQTVLFSVAIDISVDFKEPDSVCTGITNTEA